MNDSATALDPGAHRSPAAGTEWELAPLARRALGYGLAVCAVAAIWAGTIWTSTHIQADPSLRTAALFVHLGSLIVGMGAVLTLDWLSVRWIFGLLTRQDVMRLAGNSHMLIWCGLAGLTVSGALLRPDVHALTTQIKLVAVLALALNGVAAHGLQHRLNDRVLSRRLMVQASIIATVSQAGWWTATVVGFLNHG